MLRLLPLTTALLLAPTLARAGDTPVSPIWNGTEAGVCDWPSVVQMEDSCSGTLVHPQVVIYAGHCGPDYTNIHFGEGGDNQAFSVKTEFCVSSGFETGHDYSVCKLEQPVTDVPIVPILMGCETEALQIGKTVTMIGFGEAEAPKPYGIKRVAHSLINDFADDEIFVVSDDGMDTCFGDSGGPVMIQLDDGTWRVFGITSYGISDECGTGTWYSMMHIDLAWFEDQTGVDITPCHTADGTWDPGPECGGFPTDPGTGVGAWPSCGIGPIGDAASSTCGAGFGASADDTPPVAAVTMPETGVSFMAVDSLPLTITGTAHDDPAKPDGWGIQEVRLVFNDKQLPTSERFIPPYSWDVKLPTGQYLIQILAIDHTGNEGLSPPVAIGVNKPAPELPEPPAETTTTGDPTTATGTGDDDGATSDPATTDDLPTGTPPDPSDATSDPGSTGNDSPSEDEETSCGRCTTTTAPSSLALAMLLLLTRRRRR